MPSEVIQIERLEGLTEAEVSVRRQRYGKNTFQFDTTGRWVRIVWDVLKEPMFLLLVVACTLYFVLGQISEGLIMLAAMCFVTAISIYQEIKSTKALEALKQLTEPKVSVIRNGKDVLLNVEELVPGDIMLLEEGNKVPADAVVVEENDLFVNESIVTGESLPVEKSAVDGHNLIYQGTTINSGKCYARVTATGNRTVLGKLGKSISTYAAPKTLLQQQIGIFVRRLALFGVTAFVLIFLFNYIENKNFITSLLFGLTLAMAAIPEEIPVAFSSFMALGAYHLSKWGIITRQPQIIENLGAVTVICLDKTGTITENVMQVETIYDFDADLPLQIDSLVALPKENVLYYATLASEVNPFDPMEIAIQNAYRQYTTEILTEPLRFIYEYPLQGQPPMMTHVYEYKGQKIAAAKGAAERILKVCKLSQAEVKTVMDYIHTFTSKGCRVIGIASAVPTAGDLPLQQDDLHWKFEGLVSLYDPPKANVKQVLEECYAAGISIKLITGDYAETAINISTQAGIVNAGKYIMGNQIMTLGHPELLAAVKEYNIFARMFPDAKLKVINALKENGEIVAMTGDGVNDGPALKSVHIGIAMGKKGTEIARQSAGIILTDDNLEKVVEAIRQGRKIFNNLKKAVRYIISIHIPIILTASLPLILGWRFPNIFTPVHVIFLELIMGPTCSIFFEREPVEGNLMKQKPRESSAGLFTREEFFISTVQGLIITAGVLLLYYIYMTNHYQLPAIRTLVFTTLLLSNIFLTFTNRSFSENIANTIRYKNNLALPVVLISVVFLILLYNVPFVQQLFQLAPISSLDFSISFLTALFSVLWFEVYKTLLKKRT